MREIILSKLIFRHKYITNYGDFLKPNKKNKEIKINQHNRKKTLIKEELSL